jgi:PERQ amino acid-rich with GYF domain-containing protein
MATITENSFGMLNEDKADKNESVSPKKSAAEPAPNDIQSAANGEGSGPNYAPPASTDGASAEGGEWNTVQSSSSKKEQRRLAPQWTLSKKDMGVDEGKNAAPKQPEKQKIIRFTRSELLQIRKPTKVLSELADMPDIISVPPLEPAVLQAFNLDDFHKIWNADRDRQKDGVQMKNGKGKGRDRDGQWGHRDEDEKVTWDDVARKGSENAATFDLSDFAAATAAFAEMNKKATLEDNPLDGELGGDMEDDPMERLLQEQMEMDRLVDGVDGAENAEQHGEEEPEWGDEDYSESKTALAEPSAESQQKRNLLLGVLDVKSAKKSNETIAEADAKRSADAGGLEVDMLSDLMGGLESIAKSKQTEAAPAPAPTAPASSTPVSDEEWLYLDLDNNVQGPFDSQNMRRWHESGYFKIDLPIKLKGWGQFHPLGSLFSSPGVAFMTIPREPSAPRVPSPKMTSPKLVPPTKPPPSQAMLETQDKLRQIQLQQQQIHEQLQRFAAMDQQRQAFVQEHRQTHVEHQRERERDMMVAERQYRHFLEQARNAPMNEQQRNMLMAQEQQRHMHAMMEKQRLMQGAEQQHQQSFAGLQAKHQEQVQKRAIYEQQQAQLHAQRQQLTQLMEQQQREYEQKCVAIQHQHQQQVLMEQQKQQQQMRLEQERQREEMRRHEEAQMAEKRRHEEAQMAEKQKQKQLEDERKRKEADELAEMEQESFLQRKQKAFLEKQAALHAAKDEKKPESPKAKTAAAVEKKPARSSAASGSKAGRNPAETQSNQEQGAKTSTSSSSGSGPSSKLKSLLGVNAGGAAWGAGASTSAPSSKSLQDIQMEVQKEEARQQRLLEKQLQHRQQQEAQKEPSANGSLVANASWATKKQDQGNKASLRDIMKQDTVSEKAEEASEGATRSISNSYASRSGIASGPPPNSAGPPASPSTRSGRPAVSKKAQPVKEEAGSKGDAWVAVQERGSAVAAESSAQIDSNLSDTKKSSGSSKKTNRSEFGGKGMSADMIEWCQGAMKFLTGNDDITLLKFCMSLQSGAEIREYLSAYLGSTPQVSQFASEFIRRKEGNPASNTNAFSSTVPTSHVAQGGPQDIEKKVVKRNKKQRNPEF